MGEGKEPGWAGGGGGGGTTVIVQFDTLDTKASRVGPPPLPWVVSSSP